jgi:hypothetical protein
MIDDRLRVAADELKQQFDHTVAPPLPPLPSRQQRTATLVRMTLAVLAAVAVIGGVVALVGRNDTHRTVTSPTTDTTSSTASSASTTSSLSSPSTTVPLSTTPLTTALQEFGVPLDSFGADGGPAALGVVPHGYRPVLVQEDGTDQQSVPTTSGTDDDWSATLIRKPTGGPGTSLDITVVVQTMTNDDPYYGYPALLTAPDVTFGAFTGRVDDNSTVGYSMFVARLNDTQHVIIGGHATVTDVQTVARGLVLRPDGVGADATVLPTGYQLVDEGSRARPMWTREWAVGYATGQQSRSQVTIWARRNAREPAVMGLMHPHSQLVDINGHEGVLSAIELIFDVSPTFQIDLSRSFSGSASTVSDDELIAMARSVVGVSDQQFTELKAAADASPLSPTDMPCGFYLRGTNAQSDNPNADRSNGFLSVPAGGHTVATVTVDLTTRQPLGAVTIGLEAEFSGPSGAIDTTSVIVGRVDHITDPATVSLIWDGTINGAPAPSGTYRVLVHAQPSNPTDATQCVGGTSDNSSIQVQFVVS